MDLGGLEFPEPSLFYQAKYEELDHLDITSSTWRDVHTNTMSKYNASSAEITSPVSLVSTWKGSFTITDEQTPTPFSILIIEQNANGAFKGYAIDADTAWIVTGSLRGNRIDFIKSTHWDRWNFGHQWIGNLDTETETIGGQWDSSRMMVEAAPASAIMEGITEWRKGNGRQDDGMRSDATKMLGTFSLVRQPPWSYFLYTPPVPVPQKRVLLEHGRKSRPKALWKIVRDAVKHWHRSRHLKWDELQKRRDNRNRYVQWYLTQEHDRDFYYPYGLEWATLICQTHPSDLRLWHAIAQYKERRMIKLSYVYNINAQLSLTLTCTLMI